MDPTTLQDREDWEELRLKLGELLKRRTFARGIETFELASRIGRKAYSVERVFAGRIKAQDRYEQVALALDWSLDQALEMLTAPAEDLPAPRLRKANGQDLELTLFEDVETMKTPHAEPVETLASNTSKDPSEPTSDEQNTSSLVAQTPHVEHDETATPSTKTGHAEATSEETNASSFVARTPLDEHDDTSSPSTKTSPDEDASRPSKPSRKGASRRKKTPKKSAKTSAKTLTFIDHRTRLAGELKDLITASGKSQTTWAEAIGVSQSTISSVLAARHKRRTHYDALARELGYYIAADFSLTKLDQVPTPAPFQVSPSPGLLDALEPEPVASSTLPSSTPKPSVPSTPAPSPSSPARFELDPGLEALVHWSAAQRGIDPKIWLTLAVAAYHEAQAT